MKLLILVLALLLTGCHDESVSAEQWNRAMNEALFDTSDQLSSWGVSLTQQPTVTREEACRMIREAYGESEADCVTMGWMDKVTGDLRQSEITPVLASLKRSMDHPRWENEYEFANQDKICPETSLETFDSLKMKTGFDVDWNQVKVEKLQESSIYFQPVMMESLRYQFHPVLASQQFQYKGYTVYWNVSAAGVHVHASRSGPLQMRTRISFDLNQLHPVMQWEKDRKRIQLDLKMNQKIGIHKGMMNTVSTDFSGVDPHDLLQSLKESFQNGIKDADTVIPIAKITIPIPEIPAMDLGLILSLHCYSGGKAELILSQEGSVGMEVRNGTVRFIHDFDHQEEVQFQGSASLSAAIKAVLSIAGVPLMDCSAQTGIRGVMRTTGWLDTNEEIVLIDAGELPSDMQPIHPSLRFCSDLNVHGILNLSCNSDHTVAGKMGMYHKVDLIDERNGTLNPHGLTHIENGLFVPQCTRNKKVLPTLLPSVEVGETILLQQNQLILDPGEKEQITIQTLPQGVGLQELIYRVRDPEIATVLQTGSVQAVNSGNTVITVSEPSGKYKAFIHVHVREAS